MCLINQVKILSRLKMRWHDPKTNSKMISKIWKRTTSKLRGPWTATCPVLPNRLRVHEIWTMLTESEILVMRKMKLI